MLNIPKSVKKLLHADSVNKNIRIHFPNGERSDICNDQIVKDSVELTESLCSQEKLKFGLCESPMFECEVVGVGNVRGATIEVFCEIYCDASIEGSVWKNDLQHYVYQIPYGTFVIDSCKRQTDIIYRKIVAYNDVAQKKWDIVNSELVKICSSSSYTPNIGYFLAINGLNFVDDLVNKTEISAARDRIYSKELGSIKNGPLQRYDIRIEGNGCRFLATYDDNIETDALYQADINFIEENNATNILNQIYAALRELDCDFSFSLGTYNKFMSNVFNGYIENHYTNPSTLISIKITESSASNYMWYPYANGFYNGESFSRFSLFQNIRVYLYKDGNRRELLSIPITTEEPKFYKIKYRNDTSVYNSMRYNIPCISSAYSIQFGDKLNEMINPFIELLGEFFYFGREKNSSVINIKQQFGLVPSEELYPGIWLDPKGPNGGSIVPSDYQSCWYDDEYNVPFGAIKCVYKNTSDQDCEFLYYFGGFTANSDPSTYQIYYLDDNKIIKEKKWTQAQIQTICETIADSINGVYYMPIDFKGRGLPYVEAGDTFEILTKSNDSITTIVLNRTIKGEQCLIDSYKSV